VSILLGDLYKKPQQYRPEVTSLVFFTFIFCLVYIGYLLDFYIVINFFSTANCNKGYI